MSEQSRLGGQGYLGLSVIWGFGLALGVFSVYHALTAPVGPPSALYVLTPIIFNGGLVLSGLQLWRHRVPGPELLRIAGWVVVGVVVSGLLITWTVTHQLIRGGSFSYETFVTVNNLSFGGLIGVILGWLDANNRRYERELKAERDKLDRQNKRLDEFAGIVSHDLRNPLNVATLNLQTAKRSLDEEALDKVEDALDRMERIVDDVLAMARDGEEVEETERVTLEVVAAESWGSVEADDAKFEVHDEFAFQADRSQLRRVLENLFRNAVEHGVADTGGEHARQKRTNGAPAGRTRDAQQDGPELTVAVGACADGFYVEDDGVGFSQDDPESLFQTDYSETDGAGLGLSIVKRMIEAHGWDISVTESEGGGARFEVTGVEPATRDPGDVIDETWEAVRTKE